MTIALVRDQALYTWYPIVYILQLDFPRRKLRSHCPKTPVLGLRGTSMSPEPGLFPSARGRGSWANVAARPNGVSCPLEPGNYCIRASASLPKMVILGTVVKSIRHGACHE